MICVPSMRHGAALGVHAHAHGCHGPRHGHERGLKDVDAGDFVHPGKSDAPAYGKRADFPGQTVALIRLQHLGVVQSHEIETVGENDGSGHHGTGQTASSGLIRSGGKLFLYVRGAEEQPLFNDDFLSDSGHVPPEGKKDDGS